LVKDLGMGFVALAFATIMLLAYRSQADEFYKAIDWDLIGFFMGLFVVLNVMEHAHVLEALGKGIEMLVGDGRSAGGTGALLLSSAACSSVMDNVPVAAMLAKILAAMNTPGTSRLWWAVVFGANLGGNLTPIGSVSSLVAIAIMQKHGVGMPFMTFRRKVFPFVAIELVLSILYVLAG
jgi:Na+/H+ antiporter NhaD/arsenite permease-like protein